MVIEVQRSSDISAEDMSVTTESNDRFDERLELSERKTSTDVLIGQNKLAKSWTNSCSMDYTATNDDGGVMAVCRPTQVANNRGSATASIVGSLLQKASGLLDGVYIGGVARGLHQKIQELRSEKEAEELIQCPSSFHSDQDSPIDFSVKRRSSFSGSLTDDSQTSLRSPGNGADYNDLSPGNDSGSANHSVDISKRSTPSPERFDDHKLIGQPELDLSPAATSSPFLSIGSTKDLKPNLLTSGSPLGAFSQMTAVFADPRIKKCNRPFKAYPKDPLQMPLGFFGIPGMASAAQKGVESGIFAEMNNDDIVSLYNQQLQLLRDKQLPGQESNTSPAFQISASNKVNLSPQHRDHHSNSPYPALNMSPPLLTTDHLQTSRGLTTNLPIPNTNGSVNTTTLVSSTSSFGHPNSRKRPRSLPDEQKDAAYWERRRKNNDAAKRSRDARRAKEDEIAIRAALLEQENLKLRVEVAALKTETARLRCLLYN